MTLSEAQAIMTNERLVFGDLRQIEASDLIELAEKAKKVGTRQFICEACEGYGKCGCTACDEGEHGNCKSDGVCAKCGGEGLYKINFNSNAVEGFDRVYFEEALGLL